MDTKSIGKKRKNEFQSAIQSTLKARKCKGDDEDLTIEEVYEQIQNASKSGKSHIALDEILDYDIQKQLEADGFTVYCGIKKVTISFRMHDQDTPKLKELLKSFKQIAEPIAIKGSFEEDFEFTTEGEDAPKGDVISWEHGLTSD